MEREKDIILQICRDQYDHKEVSSEELLKAVNLEKVGVTVFPL
jgi:hypothetical protein